MGQNIVSGVENKKELVDCKTAMSPWGVPDEKFFFEIFLEKGQIFHMKTYNNPLMTINIPEESYKVQYVTTNTNELLLHGSTLTAMIFTSKNHQKLFRKLALQRYACLFHDGRNLCEFSKAKLRHVSYQMKNKRIYITMEGAEIVLNAYLARTFRRGMNDEAQIIRKRILNVLDAIQLKIIERQAEYKTAGKDISQPTFLDEMPFVEEPSAEIHQDARGIEDDFMVFYDALVIPEATTLYCAPDLTFGTMENLVACVVRNFVSEKAVQSRLDVDKYAFDEKDDRPCITWMKLGDINRGTMIKSAYTPAEIDTSITMQ